MAIELVDIVKIKDLKQSFDDWIDKMLFDLEFFKKINAHNSHRLARICSLEHELKDLKRMGLNTRKNENWEVEKDVLLFR